LLQKKSFWQRPEGITGGFVLGVLLAAVGYATIGSLSGLAAFLTNDLNLAATLVTFGIVLFFALDNKFRTLIWYGYKSLMRKITSIFVKIDPIATLKSYIEHLEGSLVKLNRQVVQLRQQKHKLKELIVTNERDIASNLVGAQSARDINSEQQMVLKSRKAGRLQESNMRLEDLYKRMDTMHTVLSRMQTSSVILYEDMRDQVLIKETEHKAIVSSQSAMRSAMDIIRGDNDKKMVFDDAVEAMADDVSMRIGEMERFMDLSGNVMNAIDLNNRIFEDEGIAMLEKWENESKKLLAQPEQALDLNEQKPLPQVAQKAEEMNRYDDLFK
jgi:hypothetical protein